jgi:hypothetical protein
MCKINDIIYFIQKLLNHINIFLYFLFILKFFKINDQFIFLEYIFTYVILSVY